MDIDTALNCYRDAQTTLRRSACELPYKVVIGAIEILQIGALAEFDMLQAMSSGEADTAALAARACCRANLYARGVLSEFKPWIIGWYSAFDLQVERIDDKQWLDSEQRRRADAREQRQDRPTD